MKDTKLININSLDFNITVEECFRELLPHPKFSLCRFDNYQEDINYPSQLELKTLLKDTITRSSNIKKPTLITKLLSRKITASDKNIYIDGSYGIGKTHLLSACFHDFSGSKSFLSFLELTYFINYYGLEKTIDEFKKIKLLLLDEFDLDDPATTRMMARFITEINPYTTIITTSNRLPKELGGTNFDTEMFAKELGIIADSFKTIIVEGESFRIKLAKWQATYSDKTFDNMYKNFVSRLGISMIDYDNLNTILQSNHPFKFFIIPKNISALFIKGFIGFKQLNDALRFSIFIDHCYYYDIKLFFNIAIDHDTLFPKDILQTTFERQFLRCLSRLDELAIFFKS